MKTFMFVIVVISALIATVFRIMGKHDRAAEALGWATLVLLGLHTLPE